MRLESAPCWGETGPVIVGIIGGSGSGKTWLARKLVDSLGPDQAATICQDSFYKDLSSLTPTDRAHVNFDHPNALDWAMFRKCLTHIASGRVARIPRYNFSTHTRERDEIILQRRSVMIFEGLWLLHRPALRRFFQLTVFIEAGSELCLARRLTRDVAERGRSPEEVTAWYRQRVHPMQKQFVDPQARRSNMILCAPLNEQHVSELEQKISNLR